MEFQDRTMKNSQGKVRDEINLHKPNKKMTNMHWTQNGA